MVRGAWAAKLSDSSSIIARENTPSRCRPLARGLPEVMAVIQLCPTSMAPATAPLKLAPRFGASPRNDIRGNGSEEMVVVQVRGEQVKLGIGDEKIGLFMALASLARILNSSL